VRYLWLVLLLPLLMGSDGDNLPTSVSPGEINHTPNSAKHYLCDSVDGSGARTCPTLSKGYDACEYIFALDETGGCSVCTVIIEDASLSTGDFHTVTTLECGSNTSSTWTGKLHKHIRARTTLATGCTDLDVVAEFHFCPNN
jgi:hypothetical protein